LQAEKGGCMSTNKKYNRSLLKLNDLVDTTSRLVNEVISFVEEDLTVEMMKCVPTALLKITLNRMINSLGRRRTVEILNNAARAINNGEDVCTIKSLQVLHPSRVTRYVGENRTFQDEHPRELQ